MSAVAAPCSADFVRLADELGGIPCDADPVVTLRAPWDLAGWTLPVVELLVIAGAVLALVHALSRLRRREPAWLALWLASVVYVLAIEPPLYFPESFGLEEYVGLVFAHNVFTIEFLYDRLPLYIVALYPAGIYLSHALVDRLGVFRRHGIVVGAVTVGAVHHLFYEIFDQLGPQLRWWVWNADAASNDPMFASVPLTSVVLFATTSPALLVGLARWLLFRTPSGDAGDEGDRADTADSRDTTADAGGDGTGRSRPVWALRTLAVGLATVVLQPVVSLPATLLGALDGDDKTIDAAVLWAIVVTMAAVAVRAVITARPGPAASDPTRTRRIDGYPIWYGAAYLAVFAVLWLTALPDLLDAVDGRTADGALTGYPLYALGCGLAAAWLILRAGRGTATSAVDPDAGTAPTTTVDEPVPG